MKRFLWSVFFLVFLTMGVIQAQQAIEGTVLDENKQPLIGASVRLAGASVAVVTDLNGKFKITVPDANSLLQISYVGYATEDFAPNGRSSIEVVMTPDLTALQQVVVIGYGSTKKADLTSSITTIKSEELAKLPVTSLEQSLQGKAAGVTVIQSGTPGGGASIRIRGTNSPNGTDPLWVVDGIINAAAPNANDVESMQILKDAAACAIYGSRGSNGVIIVTTKKGVKGEPKVSFKSYYGYQSVDNKIDMMSGDQYIQYWENNKKVNEYVGPNGETYPNGLSRPAHVDSALANPSVYNANTDWLKQLYRNGNVRNLNFTISNGTDKGNYFASVDNRVQDGVQIGSGYKQTSLQVNSELQKGIFKIGENLNVKQSEWLNNGSRLQSALRQSPLLAVRNPSPPATGIVQWPGNTSLDNSNNANPVADIENSYNKSVSEAIQTGVYVEAEPLKGLTLKSTYAIMINNSNDQSKRFAYLDGQSGPQVNEVSMYMGNSRYLSNQFENIITYKFEYGSHSATIMGGYTREQDMYRGSSGNHYSFNVSNPESFGSADPTSVPYLGGGFAETSLESMLARMMYNYKGKYYLTANVRRDGSSKFLTGRKYSVFPSFSLGWRISDETFMKGLTSVNNLKFRGSYGSIGSQHGIEAYNVRRLSSSANYIFGNTLQQGITQGGLIDKDLKWETTYSTNIGFDLDMFSNFLSITADYFYKRTDGLFFETPVAYSAGLDYKSLVERNAGEALNKGLEMTATVRNNKGEFTYEAIASFTKENTEITRLIKDNFYSGKTQYYDFLTLTSVNHGIGDFYGYVFDGIYQIGDKDIPLTLQEGDVRYKDLDGDGKITQNDQTYIGKPVPDYTFGLTFNCEWKNFDASIFFQGVLGNQIFNHNRYHTEILAKGFNQSTKALKAWRPDFPSNDVPRYTDQHTNNYSLPSSRFLEDGSYMRFQNLTIGYSIPSSLINRLKIDKLRIYASAQNLFTVTNYTGIDPEISSSAPSWEKKENLYRGIDNSVYPVAKTFVAGLELNF